MEAKRKSEMRKIVNRDMRRVRRMNERIRREE